MSVKQYETYLAETFIEWVSSTIQPGERYQFKSPDPDNALKLWQAFVSLASGNKLEIAPGQHLTCVQCNSIQLIPVLHGTTAPAFTENYISHLRDQVSGRNGVFAHTALLIIHNSMLDTLLNSTKDVAAPDAIWHPETFRHQLEKLITTDSARSQVSRCLLGDQLTTILDEGATVFGFSSLYRLLDDGKLDFSELKLFNDNNLLNFSDKQLRARLNENQKLYRQIEDSIERYSGQLENVLTEFSTKFIQEHFVDKDDWRELDFSVYLDEKTQNSEQKLVLENIVVESGVVWQRAKSASKAGKRDISVLVQAQPEQSQVELEFIFQGNDLQDNQIKIAHHRQLQKERFWRISRHSKILASVPFDGRPCFFSLEIINRNNSAEEYKFRLLLVEQGQFWLNEIQHCYRIEPGKGQLTLQLEDNELRIAETGDQTCLLDEESDDIDCRHYALVNFETLANQSELIKFALISGDSRLLFNIEGPGAEEGLTLPLLFDQSRFNKLFKEEGNATWNRMKGRVILDNIEHNVVGVRQQLLMQESSLIEHNLLSTGSNNSEFALDELQAIYPDLHNAYHQLFVYYQRRNTLPSLVSWSAEYRALVSHMLATFEQALQQIGLSRALTAQEKRLLHLGICRGDNYERLSPLHPLVLAYHLQLAETIIAEPGDPTSASFASLPQITLDRLVVSGLMPFVYHSEHEYAQLQPMAENRFWIDIVPQRQMSHEYVKRLVKDKLNEFTDAYSRLFQSAGNNALVINAINLGDARELFLGLVEYFKQEKDGAISIHVNCYDERLLPNAFDRFAESGSYEQLKNDLGLNSGAWRAEADMLIDLLRSRLTFSKFVLPPESDKLAYAHLAFFTNTAPVDCRQIRIEDAASGVLCHGLIAGEGAETQGDAYFTAFGLRNVDTEPYCALRLARLLGCLWQPARQSNSQYHGQGISLAVSGNFKQLLNRSYDSSLWTTIIDPKVTLDFFTSQKDVVLIHYSDQYTSCAGYDAVTVTKQVELFLRLLQTGNQAGQSTVDSQQLLAEFNAFNGEWLLKMLRSNEKERKEKHGIIGAYKFVQSMLQQSDICWVPLSVAEMIRVSGNVGLRMKESDLSRHLQGYQKGAISDDVLFVGFKDNNLYLLPLEVKTGARPDYNHAGQQARELKRYLQQDILGPQTLASQLYRALFIRQVLMQVEKLRLYGVLDNDKLSPLLERREWWLTGDYKLGELTDYVDGFVVAHVDSKTCFVVSYKKTTENILQIEIPFSLLPSLIAAQGDQPPLAEIHLAPEKYRLKPACDMSPSQPTQVTTQADSQTNSIPESPQPEASTLPTDNVNNMPLQVLFGHDVLRQSPLYWAPTNTAKFMNTNTGIIGTMGTGKTQFTKSLVTQLMRNQSCNVDGKPIGLLIFDYKSDYVDDAFLEATGAKRYQLSLLPYNPLSLFGDMPMLPRHTAMAFAETMGKAYNLGVKQRMKLVTLIMECYDLAGIVPHDRSTWNRIAPTIEDVWQQYLAQEKVDEDSLYAALYNLAGFQIFETDPEKMTSLYDLVEGVTVIELAGYPSEIQNLVVALTLDLFYAQMQKRGKPTVRGDYRQLTKMILVDEADNFMRQDFASLRKILKEGREYGVGAILSTQEITHFKTGENNYASYILTWVIHRVSEIRNADIKAVFNIDDKGEQESLMGQIRQLEKHFSLYVDGDKQVKKMRDKAFWELIQGQEK
ncbi:DNA phosphorothioation-dependent restriction protein DptH [Salmonella enterica subsp. diarizonae]|uniref:DNA phosphorothioation-dependent restriction protein DptH n=1 Tax=Salmonella enterica TaxID=28901 RepID=A0A403N4D9_SALER|nr:DNA phosphorothioation-dependent restriction protein DptH [Salmonella enterica]ECC8971357.1 DNA phosphorothioation-dependent restriction protein DptH [Salmonella enterica subsp. diarizonae]EDN4535576.1 DNA phosphorothioation-dependent restriction protein DptH [Salmonella enterica subsp. diarizonae serovar 47:k:z35]EDQ3841612.1 DNA phosphorothioation-dependent restriction protein DptH [Salmonella enterica subsp. enterica serovar Bareilly]EDQ4423753.1 DNA phosphorothioation-dependent restricti